MKSSDLSQKDASSPQDQALSIKNTIDQWYANGANVNAISQSIESLRYGIKLLEALIPFPDDISRITFRVKDPDLTQINELARILQGISFWRIEVMDGGELTFEDSKLVFKYFTTSELKEILINLGGQLEYMQIEINSCISLGVDLENLKMIFKLPKCDVSQFDGMVFKSNQDELTFKGCFVTPESAVQLLELIMLNSKNPQLLNANVSIVKNQFEQGYGILAQAAKMKVKYLKFDNFLETTYQEMTIPTSEGTSISNGSQEISQANGGSSIQITNTLKILIGSLDLTNLINVTKSRGDTLTNLEITHSEQLFSDSICEYLDCLPFNMKSATIISQTRFKQGVNFAFNNSSIVNYSGFSYFNHFKIDSYCSNTLTYITIVSKCTDIGDISFALQFLKRLLFLLPKQQNLQQFTFEIIHPVDCKDYSICCGKTDEIFELLASQACFLMNSVKDTINIKEVQQKEDKKSNIFKETMVEINYRKNQSLRVTLGDGSNKFQRSVLDRIICSLKFEEMIFQRISIKNALYLIQNVVASRFSKLSFLSLYLSLSEITSESLALINKILLMQASTKTEIKSDSSPINQTSQLFITADLATNHFQICSQKESTQILHELSTITNYSTLTLNGSALSQDSFDKLANIFVDNSVSDNLKSKKTIIFLSEMGPRRTSTLLKICHSLQITAKIKSNYYSQCDVSTFHQFSKLYSRPFKLFSEYRTTGTLVSADLQLFGCFNLKFNGNNLWLHFQSDVNLSFSNMIRIIQQALEAFPSLQVLKISTTETHFLSKQEAQIFINFAIKQPTLIHIGLFRNEYPVGFQLQRTYFSEVLDYFYKKRTLLRTLSAVSQLGLNRIEKLQEFYEFFPTAKSNPQLEEIKFSFNQD